MDVRVGNRGALVEGHHVLLGQSLSGFSATSGSGAALQGADDCSGRRLFVVVEVVLGKLDQLESLLFDVLPVGLSVLVSGLLLGLTRISRLILTWISIQLKLGEQMKHRMPKSKAELEDHLTLSSDAYCC